MVTSRWSRKNSRASSLTPSAFVIISICIIFSKTILLSNAVDMPQGPLLQPYAKWLPCTLQGTLHFLSRTLDAPSHIAVTHDASIWAVDWAQPIDAVLKHVHALGCKIKVVGLCNVESSRIHVVRNASIITTQCPALRQASRRRLSADLITSEARPPSGTSGTAEMGISSRRRALQLRISDGATRRWMGGSTTGRGLRSIANLADRASNAAQERILLARKRPAPPPTIPPRDPSVAPPPPSPRPRRPPPLSIRRPRLPRSPPPPLPPPLKPLPPPLPPPKSPPPPSPPKPRPPPPPKPLSPPPSPKQLSPPPPPPPPKIPPPPPPLKPRPPPPQPKPQPTAKPPPSPRLLPSSSPMFPPPNTSSPPRVLYTMKSAVLTVDMCGQPSSANLTFIRNLWSKSLPDYYAQASFGAMAMPPEYNVIVPSRVQLGCGGWSNMYGIHWNANVTNPQNILAWGEAADTAAMRNLSFPIYNFFHRVYLMPESIGGITFGSLNCPYSMDGFVGLWSGVNVEPNRMFNMFLHELGHNLGLQQSKSYNSSGQEVLVYGDLSCPMAEVPDRLPIHYNAPQSVQLGWTTPQRVLRDVDIKPGTWYGYLLTGLADSPVSSLQIFPATWMPSDSGWGPYDMLYISFRHYTPTNTDRGLSVNLRNKIYVHLKRVDCTQGPVLLATLDVGAPARGTAGGAGLDVAASWPDRNSAAEAHKLSPLLVVRPVRIDVESGLAEVSLCRAQQFAAESGTQCSDGLDNDCDGKVDC